MSTFKNEKFLRSLISWDVSPISLVSFRIYVSSNEKNSRSMAICRSNLQKNDKILPNTEYIFHSILTNFIKTNLYFEVYLYILIFSKKILYKEN